MMIHKCIGSYEYVIIEQLLPDGFSNYLIKITKHGKYVDNFTDNGTMLYAQLSAEQYIAECIEADKELAASKVRNQERAADWYDNSVLEWMRGK